MICSLRPGLVLHRVSREDVPCGEPSERSEKANRVSPDVILGVENSS